MSRQKRLSQLTLAATILVAASATSFAQTESARSRTEATSDVAVAVNVPKVNERFANGNSTSVAPVSNVSSSFSPAKFMAAVNQSFSDTSLIVAPRTGSEISYDARTELSQEVLSVPTKTPRISFVPSRGQKLPTY